MVGNRAGGLLPALSARTVYMKSRSKRSEVWRLHCVSVQKLLNLALHDSASGLAAMARAPHSLEHDFSYMSGVFPMSGSDPQESRSMAAASLRWHDDPSPRLMSCYATSRDRGDAACLPQGTGSPSRAPASWGRNVVAVVSVRMIELRNVEVGINLGFAEAL